MSSNEIIESNLRNVNWSQIKIGGKRLSFKCHFTSNEYELLIFDLNQFKLFYQKQRASGIQGIFKNLNPGLEAPVSKILFLIKDALSKEDTNNLLSINESIENSEELNITMKSKISGVKFQYRFKLTCFDNESIRDHLIVPLLLNNAEYQSRESELIKIIQNKDKELEDFRSQGVKLSRSYLKTESFDYDNFNETTSKKNQFNEELIENPCLTLYTPLANKIYRVCMNKYDQKSAIKKTPEKSRITKRDSSSEKPDLPRHQSDSIEDENEIQGSDRLLELETKLKKEENKNKNKTPKKKKLF